MIVVSNRIAGLRRREVLAGAAALLGVVAAPALVRAQAAVARPFKLGVASGDPSPDGFVIWTRLAPEPLELHSGMPMIPFPVDWEVAADEGFGAVLARGQELARPELGHSVHAEVKGLQPGRPYWYRFHLAAETSPAGRARTLPPAGAALDRVRFVAGGCQNYEQGLYTAYRHVAGEEIDFFWHYGDYIYEGSGLPRRPRTAAGAGSPRRRALQPGRLPGALRPVQAGPRPAGRPRRAQLVGHLGRPRDRQQLGRRPGPGRHAAGDLRPSPGSAAQAYYENMPLRRSSFPRGTGLQIFRRASYGDLMDCHFLDTRQFRDDQPCGDNFKPVCAEALRPDRTIMGAAEEGWLFDGLANGRARWNLIANQVMMMPLDRRTHDEPAPIWNMDSWAGYPAARQRLLTHLQDHRITNVVVATGDEHQHYAGELRAQGAEGQVLATEFVATSISSGGDGSDKRPGTDAILARNPYCKLINDQRGYVVCEVGRDVWRSDLRVVGAVRRPDAPVSTRASFVVERGEPGLKPA